MNIATIGVEEWLNVWEKSAVYDIGQSTISSMTFEEIRALDEAAGAELFERLAAEKMSYGWIEGSDAFKEEVARLYRTVEADNVLQTNGATGANLVALLALVEPGDQVIAEYPTYQPLYEIPRALGARVDYWHIRQEAGWNPDIEKLTRLVSSETKLICINNASNPLGTVLSAEMLEQIADVARSVGAYVLSDEVYLPLQDTCAYVSMADVYDKAIVTNSLSKTYSAPGLRIGWTVSNKELADRFRVFRDYTMICGGVINDALAVHVLRNRDQVLARNRALVSHNLAIAQAWIDGEPRASWVPPKAVSTSYVQLDIPIDDERFCKELLRDQGVLLVPGSRFELPCGARLGYCAAEATLRQGLERLSTALRRFD